MKNSCGITTVTAIIVLMAVLSLPLAAQGQSVQLTWVDRTGKAIENVGPLGPYRGPDLAPDGKRFAVHRHDGAGGDIWLLDFGPGPGTRLTGGGSSAQENTMPIWSPDGSRIVYGSMRNGKGGLYTRHTDGNGAEELLIESETTKVPMSWSPDGQYIVYWVQGGIQWILPLTGDRTPFQLSESNSSHAQISPDGKWVAYQSNGLGRAEIYVQPFPTGAGKWQLSKNGGVFARWRGDGSELYFLSDINRGQMMAVEIRVNGSSIQPGEPQRLFDSGYVNFNHPGNYHTYAASRDGQRFLIPRPEAAPTTNTDNFERNARTLILFKNDGTVVGTVGGRDLYNQLSLSPDRTRAAVTKNDPEKGTQDIWVLDVATGKGTPITASKSGEPPRSPVWSPDGRQIAYIVSRDGNEAIYKKDSNGKGSEELLYKLPGSGIQLNEWSMDGRYLNYYSSQLGGNIVFVLPLEGDRKPIEAIRSEFPIPTARLSPDSRFLAYRSNESGKDQIWVRPFNPSGIVSTEKWQVSPEGGTGPTSWRADGKELYFVGMNREVLAVEAHTESGFEFGKPRTLFKAPEAFAAGAGIGGVMNISRDGERILFAVPVTPPPPPPPPPGLQITVLDREGKVVQTTGETGRYGEAAVSPDGTRVAVRKDGLDNGDSEIWSFDIATGQGHSVAKGPVRQLLWSLDGSQILYSSTRPGGYNVILRKAWDGSGSEELLYRHTPGSPLDLQDISSDGKFVTFDSGGVILVAPLTGTDPLTRRGIEVLREEFGTFGGRFSPDGRFMAYVSNESGRNEIYVQPFDASSGTLSAGGKRKVTNDGASNVVSWRGDGKEIYFRKADIPDTLVMAADVSTEPASQPGKPRFLFRSTENSGSSKNVSRDGQRFVYVRTVKPTPAPESK